MSSVLAITRTVSRRFERRPEDESVDELATELEVRAYHNESRALEQELFSQYARGLRDARRRSKTK